MAGTLCTWLLESQRSGGEPRDLRSSHRVHRARARQLRSTHRPARDSVPGEDLQDRLGDSLRRDALVQGSRAACGRRKSNPLALVIPCHRVVASSGKLHGYAGGVEVKARLLAAEQSGPANGRLF
ncbi:MAG: MGMT family protein [Deltaproteobacteria bacterium]|nr:MGMT family protein [Deltaproteobacteria bacterium]